jgi:glycosyltransferase involved in cell wall biosynthesis
MRIVHLSTMMSYYGGEVHLAQLAAGLQGRGHEVTAVVRPNSDLSRILPEMRLEICVLPMVDWFDPSSVARLSRLLRALSCDILHTHLPRDYFLAAVATLGTGIVNVGTRHQLRPLSHAFLKRPFLQRFSEFISVSKAVEEGLLKAAVVSPERLSVVYHGIENLPVTSDEQAVVGRLRLRAGATNTAPLVGFVGRLCPTKGVDTLIKASGLLKNRWPRLKIILLGEEASGSGYRTHLQGLIRQLGLEDMICFAGYLDGAGKYSRAFDIQVVPSVAEPFGLVTLEAMAAQVPVVVTHSGGSPEIVRDGVEGFLFTPGDEKALARKLDCLLDSEGLRQEMGLRGLQRVTESFSNSKMLDCTEEVYRRALGLAEPAGCENSA